MYGQQLNPIQIRPGSNGQVLTTHNGIVSWMPGGGGSTPTPGSAKQVLVSDGSGNTVATPNTIDPSTGNTTTAGLYTQVTGPQPAGVIPQNVTCPISSQPGYNGVSNFGTQCGQVMLNMTVPGYNHGNDGLGTAQGWLTGLAHNIFFNKLSSGIGQASGGVITCAGVGDCHFTYDYLHYDGGLIDRSGEAAEIIAGNGDEPNVQFTGTVPSGVVAGSTLVHLNCTSDCAYPGVGRYLTEPTAYTGYATAQTLPSNSLSPTSFTVVTNTPLPVSTAKGVLDADVLVNNPTEPQVRSTWDTPTISLTLISGQVAVGDLGCFGGPYQQTSRVLSITTPSGGHQTVTLAMKDSETAGTTVQFNGVCGMGINWQAQTNQYAPSVSYTVPLIGSDTATTINIVAQYGSSVNTYYPANVTFQGSQIFTLTRASNVVTATYDYNQPFSSSFFGQAAVSFSGTTAFNGPCLNTTRGPNTLICTQNGPDGTESPSAAQVTIGDTGYGNTRFTLVRLAQVIDVRDLTQDGNCLLIYVGTPAVQCDTSGRTHQTNGTVAIEDNDFTFPAGESVTEAHHWVSGMVGGHLYVSTLNPATSVHGLDIGVSGFDQPQNGTAAITMTNNQPINTLLGAGGVGNPLPFLVARNPYRSMLNSQYGPQNHEYAFHIGCGVSAASFSTQAPDCNQYNYGYNLFQLDSHLATWKPYFDTYTGILDFPLGTTTFGGKTPCWTDGSNSCGGGGNYVPLVGTAPNQNGAAPAFIAKGVTTGGSTSQPFLQIQDVSESGGQGLTIKENGLIFNPSPALGFSPAFYINAPLEFAKGNIYDDLTPSAGVPLGTCLQTTTALSGGVYGGIGAASGPCVPINSPSFTGTPLAPTATAGTSTTQIATTAFVGSAITTACGGNCLNNPFVNPGDLVYANSSLIAARLQLPGGTGYVLTSGASAPSWTGYGSIAVFGTPASSTSACTVPMRMYDANYDYYCVGANTWKRTSLSSF